MSTAVTLPAGLHHRAADAGERLAGTLDRPAPLPGDRSPRSARWHAQSLSKGAAGVALLHALRGDDERAHRWLRTATAEGLAAGGGAGLWYGVSAVAFALRHSASDRYAGALAQVDRAIDRLVRTRLSTADRRIDNGRCPARREYDVVLGLSGLGTYLLRRDPADPLLHDVLTYAVRLAGSEYAVSGVRVPGWWTRDVPAGRDTAEFTSGHVDLGAAHGIAGPLSLLALAYRAGARVPGQQEAIGTITAWLEEWRQAAPEGPWWPQRLTLSELRQGHVRSRGPLRPSWCYGTPGIARALQLGALASGNVQLQETAERALLACLSDPGQLDRFTDTGLCHGWSGTLLTLWCAAADSRSPDLAYLLAPLLENLLHALPGLDAENRVGLIEGSAGVAATVHTLATGADPRWASCLLIT